MSFATIVPASALQPSVDTFADMQETFAQGLYRFARDAEAVSSKGKARKVYAVVLRFGKHQIAACGPVSPAALVDMLRSRLVSDLGGEVADGILGVRGEDCKPTQTERMLRSMLRGGGMATTIGRARITASLAGHVPA